MNKKNVQQFCFLLTSIQCIWTSMKRASTSTKSVPLAAKKGNPASPAMALASKVLPVPGGPWRSTPLGQ